MAAKGKVAPREGSYLERTKYGTMVRANENAGEDDDRTKSRLRMAANEIDAIFEISYGGHLSLDLLQQLRFTANINRYSNRRWKSLSS